MDKLKLEIAIPESVYQAFEARCIAIADKVFADKVRAIQKEEIKYTRKEAAKICKISLPTLDKYIDLGDIKTQQLGRRILIPKTAIDNYLNRGR